WSSDVCSSDLLALQAEVAAEARRPDRAAQRVLVGVAVARLHLAQPDEGAGIAQDRLDHRIDAVLQAIEIDLLAFLEVGHHLGDAGFQFGVDLRGLLELLLEVGLDGPRDLAQALELAVRRGTGLGRLEREITRVRRFAARRVHPDMAADPAQHCDVAIGLDLYPVHGEWRLQPWPVKATHEHSANQPLGADPHFVRSAHDASPYCPLDFSVPLSFPSASPRRV